LEQLLSGIVDKARAGGSKRSKPAAGH